MTAPDAAAVNKFVSLGDPLMPSLVGVWKLVEARAFD